MEVFIVLAWLGVASAQFANELANFEVYNFNENKHYYTKRKYRPRYHISTPMGWLNNPAGMTYFNHQYHIFYQYHPYNGAWGHIHWGHAISDNLVDWVHYPPALIPKEYYEKHGCLAGSAIIQNNYLTLFYTGTVIVNNRTEQSQNVAISSDGVIFQKYLYNPIIKSSPNEHIEDFRNPKVWKYRNIWYMIIGASSISRQGQVLLYTSTDMFHWKQNTTIAKSLGDMGYMWESPDLFELDGEHVLILSVRGIQTDGYRFRNLYQTGYVTGTFNYQAGAFNDIELSTATFNELDFGHDFYAAQTIQTHDGRCVLIAWLGMYDSGLEESKDGWASMLTIPRELELNSEGRLFMKPLRELKELRMEILENAWYSPGEAFYAGTKAFEMIVNSSVGANEAAVVLEWNGERQYTVKYSSDNGYISVDRVGEDGVRRASWAPPGDYVHWRIFVDHSSIEVFCGAGEVVFSSRIYPQKSIHVRIEGDTQLHVMQYKLRRGFGFDHRVEERGRRIPMEDPMTRAGENDS